MILSIADLLLDQTFVAGIGNKYKSEILLLSKVGICCKNVFSFGARSLAVTNEYNIYIHWR